MEAQRYWLPMGWAMEAAGEIELAEKYEFGEFEHNTNVSELLTPTERLAPTAQSPATCATTMEGGFDFTPQLHGHLNHLHALCAKDSAQAPVKPKR